MEITKKDFNLLQKAFELEINSNNNTFNYNNIYILLTILFRLDNKKSIELLVNFFNSNEYNQMKMLNILQFLFLDKENELVKEYIKKSLLSNDINIYPHILSNIINNGLIEEYIIFILENCSENVVSYVIGCMYSYKLVIKDFTKCGGSPIDLGGQGGGALTGQLYKKFTKESAGGAAGFLRKHFLHVTMRYPAFGCEPRKSIPKRRKPT